MKNYIIRTVKMAAYYSFLGLMLQGLLVNFLFAITPAEGQNLRDIKVTVRIIDVTLEQALQMIEQKTNFKFSYTKEDIPLNEKATVIVDDESLYNILEVFAKDYGLTFNRINDQIVVKKNQGQTENLVTAVETGTLKGKITDASTKEPLLGASVMLKGTTLGTITDAKGNFELTNLTPGVHTIVVKYVGYITKTKTIDVPANQTVELNFQLEQQAVNMNDVVVTGYITGTEKRKMDTPVSVITAKEIEQTPIRDFKDLFQGVVPGASIADQGQGRLSTTLYIRGASSFSAYNPTKIYVDGIEVAQPNMLSTIDKNSIERVEVTRGVGASTLYGSGASGGVIQIFTKKGTEGSHLNLDVAAGISNSPWVSGTPKIQNYKIDYSGGVSGFTYNIGGAYNKTDPIVTTPGVDNYSLSTYAGAKLSSGSVVTNLIAKFSKTGLGNAQNVRLNDSRYPASLRLPYYWQNLMQETTLGLNTEYVQNKWWVHNIEIGYNLVNLDFYAVQPRYTTPSDTTLYEDVARYGKINIRYNSTIVYPNEGIFKSKLTLGTDFTNYETTDLYGNKIGHTFGTNLVPNATSIREGYKSGGYFVQWQPELWDKLFITAGIRAEYNDLFGSDFGMAVSPRIGAAYNIDFEDVLIKPRISYGKGIAAPPKVAKDGAVYTTYRYLPNSDIAPESQVGSDVGFDIYAFDGRLNFDVTYYNQTANNLIQNVLIDPKVGNSIYQYQNIGEVKNKGAEFSLRYTLGNFIMSGTYSIVSSKVQKLSPSYTGVLKVGDQLSNVSRSTGNINLIYNYNSIAGFGEGGTVTLELSYKGSWNNLDYMSYYADLYKVSGNPYKGSSAAYYLDYDPVIKINMALSFRINQLVGIYLNIWNLTNNTSALTTNNLYYPGRQILAGVKLSVL